MDFYVVALQSKQMVLKQKTLVMGMYEDQTTNATTNANLEHMCDIETFLSWCNLHSNINGMCAKALKEGEHMHQLKGSGTTEGRKRHR
jgi:hypothetical protein